MAVLFGANGAIAGDNSASPAINVAYPSGITAGQLLLLALYITGTSVLSANAPAAFDVTGLPGAGFGSGLWIFGKIASGSESGSAACSGGLLSGTAKLVGQMARYTGNAPSSPIELATNPATGGTGTSASPSSIGAATAADLALAILAYENTGTAGVITGSNGTWTQDVAETNSQAISLQWQSSPLAAGATRSGGSATLGTSGIWSMANFAIKPPPALAFPPYRDPMAHMLVR